MACCLLQEEVMQTFLGMVGYCVKDNGEECYEFVHHNISSDDMNREKLDYAKFGKVGAKNRVSLFHSNILQRSHLWTKFCMRKHLVVSLHGKLFICVKVKKLFEPYINDSFEVHGDGCEKVGFHLKDNYESS